MKRRDEPPGSGDHPLAGVLDRLLARERGAERPPRPQPDPAPAVAPAATPAADLPAPRTFANAKRRMLVIAAMGADEGRAALRAAARWGLRTGKHPAVMEVGCAGAAAEDGVPGDAPAPDVPRLPLASLPGGPERLRIESPEVVAELLERLRRHESASDLLLVRIPPRHRMILMRAALLAGAIIVPVDDSDDVLHEALRLSQEISESFVDLSLWIHPARPEALERYAAVTQGFLKAAPRAFDAGTKGGAALLDALPGPPEEGFLAALLAPDEQPPPAQLLQIGFLQP